MARGWTIAAAALLATLVVSVLGPVLASAERDDASPRPVGKQVRFAGCSDVEVRDAPLRVSGGCSAYGDRQALELEVLSLAGPVGLASCRISFVLTAAGDGRIWIHGQQIQDLGVGGACGDILPCRIPSGDPVWAREKAPWEGRVVSRRGEQLVATAGVCLDTCMGRYSGEVELRLSPGAGGRLVLSADRAPMGGSGVRLDGRWRLGDQPGARPLRLRR